MPIDRAPHFRLHYLDVVTLTESGLHLTATGALAMVEGDRAVRQSLLLLLSTTPGERVMLPEYGCDLQKLTFSPNDATTAGLAIHYVKQAVNRWEPRVEVVTLDARRSQANASSLEILMAYRVRATRSISRLDMAVDLAGSTDLTRTGF